MNVIKIDVGIGLVIHFKGTFEEVEKVSEVLKDAINGKERTYLVLGSGDFTVYADKSKWEIIEVSG